MNFKLTDNQKEIYDLIKSVAEKKLNKHIEVDDEADRFPNEKWKILADCGLFSLPVSEEYGGMGESMVTLALAIKILAKYCKDEGLIFSVCAHILNCIVPIDMYGTKEQKEKFLPSLIEGKKIGGDAITEPDSGSDISNLKTVAVKSQDGYVLNGSKIFITNAPLADVMIVFARHPDAMKFANISAFIAERNMLGFDYGQTFKKLGLRTSPMGEVVFQNCIIPESHILGDTGFGLNIFNMSMIWERLILGAFHIGAMKKQFEQTRDYANTRIQSGNKIGKYQSISNKLVDMQMRIDLAENLMLSLCWKYDQGELLAYEASKLKIYSAESKLKNSIDAIQIFGANGYIRESEVERQLRDSVAATIYGGTTEIQKNILAESLGIK